MYIYLSIYLYIYLSIYLSIYVGSLWVLAVVSWGAANSKAAILERSWELARRLHAAVWHRQGLKAVTIVLL